MRKLLAAVFAATAAIAVTVGVLAGDLPLLTEDDLDKLEGAFGERITVKEDPGNHRDFILLDGTILGVIEYEDNDDDDDRRPPRSVAGVPQPLGPIDISGPPPFVDVFGTIFDDGTFFATGQGTVAGFQNVTVEMEGTVGFGSTGVMDADYTMGAGGELPGGQPITYHFQSRQLVNGDVNCDGLIDGRDVIDIALETLELDVTQVDPCPQFGENLADLWEDVLPAVWGDPNCDLSTSGADMQTVLEFMSGLPPSQQPDCTPVGTAFLPVP